jgi:ribosomal protein S27E
MASSIRITCPGCDQEFLVSPQFERLNIKAKCPFCENEFAIAEGKNIIRPSAVLLAK